MSTAFERELARSAIKVSAMGLGGWAISEPFWLDGKADGWGHVDDDEAIRAIWAALGLGITFLATVDVLRDLAARVRCRLYRYLPTALRRIAGGNGSDPQYARATAQRGSNPCVWAEYR
jgi:hypothetical protein